MFSAAGVLDREQWGLTWNMLLEAGGLLVSKEIRLEIDLELGRADALRRAQARSTSDGTIGVRP